MRYAQKVTILRSDKVGRYFGITVTEVVEENGKKWPFLRKHEETIILQQIVDEAHFDLRDVLRAILKGFEKEIRG